MDYVAFCHTTGVVFFPVVTRKASIIEDYQSDASTSGLPGT